MKTARIVLLFIIVVVVLTGGYFGANMYMQNMAIKKINKTIEKNHWENLVEYGKVKANILSGSITVDNVKFTLKNNLTSQIMGVIDFKSVVVKGDLEKKYTLSAYNINYVNLNPKLPEDLANKVLLSAKYTNFKIHKKQGIIDKFDGYIKNITINQSLISSLESSNKAKFNELQKIVKFNNPVNVKIQWVASADKGSMEIKTYSIDFVNNFGIAYSAKIKNIDFNGLNDAAKELNKNPKNFMAIANIMSKLMQAKVLNFDITLLNHGLLDRVFDVLAQKRNTTKDALIKETLLKAKTIPIPSAYPAIQNFLTSKSKKLLIIIKNKQDLTVGDLFSKMRNKSDMLSYLEIKFSN